MAEVQGGRILRPSERKGRHNKVYTAKGPRDRRVRLSADTAIQFYDVQDRLGYERASEAVDWLIRKAKVSIDKLFDTSSSHNSESLTHPGAQSNGQVDYLGEISLFEKEQFSLTEESVHTSEYNSLESSMLFPYIHAGNCSTDLGSAYNQEGYDQKGQIQKLFMLNSKLDYQQTLASSAVPLFLQPLESVECPGRVGQASVIQNTGVSSEVIAKFYNSSQGHGNPEQNNVVFNQTAFMMPASHRD